MIDKISLMTVFPEIILFVMACVVALIDLPVKSPLRTRTYVVTMLTLAVVAALQASSASGGETQYAFSNMVVSDSMGNWLKCFATVAVMLTLLYGRPYASQRDMLRGGEFFTLSIFSLLGMFVMISGNNFLVTYLGLELLTLSSYALVALRRDHSTSTEAAKVPNTICFLLACICALNFFPYKQTPRSPVLLLRIALLRFQPFFATETSLRLEIVL